VSPWQIHRLIKEPQDYDVLKYMVEHTEYKPYYFPIEQAKEWLGDDGIVIAGLPHSPMQMLMIDWVGSEGGRFYIHHAKYRDKVEELYEAISKSYEAMYEIAAKSPADMVMFGDNIDGVLVNPRLYEKYFMPEYEKCAKILHEHNKIMATHMDGRVGILKDLIAKSPQDVIEALHPPPMGDLPISDALSLWKDKVIWMGYPGSVYVLGSEAVKKHALSLLRTIVPGDRLCVEMSTENLVSNKNLLTLTSVLENAELPLTDEKIDRIEKDLL
jgi:uroporphyrinogen-III decarboxylase